MSKAKRIIWSNNDYDEWLKSMIEDGYDEDELDEERYGEDCSLFLDDERGNLNKEVNGVIVAFASLGLWSGRVNGAKIYGDCIKNILSSNCDFVTWFCDRYNCRCEAIHHDGTNYILYRVAKDMETAKRLVDKVAYGGMTEAQFRKATRSLRPYIANVYGW